MFGAGAPNATPLGRTVRRKSGGGVSRGGGASGEEVAGGRHLGEERGEHLLVAARVDTPERSLHLVLVLHQIVLEGVTLDVEELVLCRPGDGQ